MGQHLREGQLTLLASRRVPTSSSLPASNDMFQHHGKCQTNMDYMSLFLFKRKNTKTCKKKWKDVFKTYTTIRDFYFMFAYHYTGSHFYNERKVSFE